MGVGGQERFAAVQRITSPAEILRLTLANIKARNCGDRLPDVALENIEHLIGEVLIIKRQTAEIILIPMCYTIVSTPSER